MKTSSKTVIELTDDEHMLIMDACSLLADVLEDKDEYCSTILKRLSRQLWDALEEEVFESKEECKNNKDKDQSQDITVELNEFYSRR